MWWCRWLSQALTHKRLKDYSTVTTAVSMVDSTERAPCFEVGVAPDDQDDVVLLDGRADGEAWPRCEGHRFGNPSHSDATGRSDG